MPPETTTDNSPASLVCPECKKETGLTKEFILAAEVLEDFYCPHCKKLVFSCKPEAIKYTYTYTGHWSGYDD
jgi:rubredoxin